MFIGRSSRSSPQFGMLMQTCVCLLVLPGLLAFFPIKSKNVIDCSKIITHRVDPHTNHVYGIFEVQGKNQIDDRFIMVMVFHQPFSNTSQNNAGSLKLITSYDDIIRRINANESIQYRIDFPLNSVFPDVAIATKKESICEPSCRLETNHLNVMAHILGLNQQKWFDDEDFGKDCDDANVNSTKLPTLPPPQNTASQVPTSYQTVQTRQPLETQNPNEVRPMQRAAVDYSSDMNNANNECGQPAQVFKSLSINGIRSSQGQFPWATPIFDNRKNPKPKYICGSTIITKQHLITAAHCMYDTAKHVPLQADDIITIPGMYNIDDFFDAELQERKVTNIIIHDNYYFDASGLAESDIAVIKIDQPIVYNDHIRPICMWKESDDLDHIVGVKGFVSGWGITENGDAKYPSYVTATVVDRSACIQNLGKLIAGSASLFCADGNGSVPCTSDSGSGFVIKRGPNYYLRGIVSNGQFDAETLTCSLDKYVVYTDIAPFRYWLSKVIKS